MGEEAGDCGGSWGGMAASFQTLEFYGQCCFLFLVLLCNPSAGHDIDVTSRWENSATGTRTRVARVRAEYPNQLDYGGHALSCKSC